MCIRDRYGKGPFGAKVIEESQGRLLAWCLIGTKSYLAYRIEREGEHQVRITPIAYLERVRKVGIALFLALFYICLLYTSDAPDERSSVVLGGRRNIKKKKKTWCM